MEPTTSSYVSLADPSAIRLTSRTPRAARDRSMATVSGRADAIAPPGTFAPDSWRSLARTVGYGAAAVYAFPLAILAIGLPIVLVVRLVMLAFQAL
jgi:hypothetical protein